MVSTAFAEPTWPSADSAALRTWASASRARPTSASVDAVSPTFAIACAAAARIGASPDDAARASRRWPSGEPLLVRPQITLRATSASLPASAASARATASGAPACRSCCSAWPRTCGEPSRATAARVARTSAVVPFWASAPIAACARPTSEPRAAAINAWRAGSVPSRPRVHTDVLASSRRPLVIDSINSCVSAGSPGRTCSAMSIAWARFWPWAVRASSTSAAAASVEPASTSARIAP